MPAVGNTVSFQVVLTGSAQQLPANALQNGGQFAAKSTNTGNIALGNTSSVSVSNSYLLEKGTLAPFSGLNTNHVWITGTASDVLTFFGN